MIRQLVLSEGVRTLVIQPDIRVTETNLNEKKEIMEYTKTKLDTSAKITHSRGR